MSAIEIKQKVRSKFGMSLTDCELQEFCHYDKFNPKTNRIINNQSAKYYQIMKEIRLRNITKLDSNYSSIRTILVKYSNIPCVIIDIIVQYADIDELFYVLPSNNKYIHLNSKGQQCAWAEDGERSNKTQLIMLDDVRICNTYSKVNSIIKSFIDKTNKKSTADKLYILQAPINLIIPYLAQKLEPKFIHRIIDLTDGTDKEYYKQNYDNIHYSHNYSYMIKNFYTNVTFFSDSNLLYNYIEKDTEYFDHCNTVYKINNNLTSYLSVVFEICLTKKYRFDIKLNDIDKKLGWSFYKKMFSRIYQIYH